MLSLYDAADKSVRAQVAESVSLIVDLLTKWIDLIDASGPPTPQLKPVEESKQISSASPSQLEPIALNDPPAAAVALPLPTPSPMQIPSLSKHSSIPSSTRASSLSAPVPQSLSTFS